MEFIEIIQSVGFPIACVIALGLYSYKTTDRLLALTEKVTDALTTTAEKMEELSNTIKEFLEEKENKNEI